MKKTLWLAGLIFLVTMIYGTICVVTQQVLRMGANDPQIQLAEDMATQLNNGTNASLFNLGGKTDISSSLSPFLMIYDSNKQLISSTAVLDGQSPVLPPGVLTNTKSDHENRLTWQPKGGVRIAAVVVKTNTGYVLAGRSLREVEKRESNATNQVIIGWLLTVGFLLAWAWLLPLLPKPKRG